MIIIKSQGRLGNQLFQYAAVMSAARSDETVFLVGFVELRRHFGTAVDKRARWLSYRFHSRLSRFPKSLLRIPFVGKISLDCEGASFRRQNGILGVFNFTAGYCQDPRLVSKEAAKELMSVFDHCSSVEPRQASQGTVFRCFVHIRRGDYLRLREFSTPPLTWFKTQMDRTRQENGNVIFVVCSDEPGWAAEAFRDEPSVEVVDADEKKVLQLMSECDGGVLSPSTFSWWAAYFALERGAPGPFIAPKYWLGWKRGTWYPQNIAHKHFEYVSAPR